MLHFYGAEDRGSWPAGAVGGLMLLSLVLNVAPARAQEIQSGGCVRTWRTSNCVTRWAPAGDPFVRSVPPMDAEQRARAERRDRRWVDRCRPIVAPDRYGVARYRYAMPGCEFGVGED